jgi:hypothetical protein
VLSIDRRKIKNGLYLMSQDDYIVQCFLIFLIVFQGSTNEVFKNEVYKFFVFRPKFINLLNTLLLNGTACIPYPLTLILERGDALCSW